jgi:hypothetical protein
MSNTVPFEAALPNAAVNNGPEVPPYGVIWKEFADGTIIPFLGAGASLCGRPMHEGQPRAWKGAEDSFLPNGSELGGWLADLCSFPEPSDVSDLAKVASYYEVQARRRLLISRLREVFAKEYAPGPVHQFLAESPKPLLIVTTNYDDLIEKAFIAKGRPYHLVVYPEWEEYAGSVLWWKPGAEEPEAHKPTVLPLSLDDTTIIYKMHGTASARTAWNSFVITEEDYVRFLWRMTEKSAVPAHFMMHFRESAFLFLGYGLRDWNLRVMLENLHSSFRNDVKSDTRPGQGDPFGDYLGKFAPRKPELTAWAIQNRPSSLERTLWQSRNIRIYDMALDDFIARVRAERLRDERRRVVQP